MILNHNLGKLFPPAMRTAGWFFIFLGTYTIFISISESSIPMGIGGILLFLIGFFIAITPHGILINIEQKKYKNYTTIFGYKQGSWKPYSEYPFITLIQNNESTMAFSRSNRSAVTSSYLFYDICLLDHSHRTKLLVKRLKNKEEAVDIIKELSKLLDLTLAKYNPQLSTNSQKMKQPRR